MKTIKLLQLLINTLYFTLITISVFYVIFFTIIFTYGDALPIYLQGYKMLFKFVNWKILLSPIMTVVNYILFILSIYYLRKSIHPFIEKDFYSYQVINNLKKAGKLFIFIGTSTVLLKIISPVIIQTSIPISSPFLLFLGIISSIDIMMVFVVIGLFFLLFSSAFENARELKEENNLTI